MHQGIPKDNRTRSSLHHLCPQNGLQSAPMQHEKERPESVLQAHLLCFQVSLQVRLHDRHVYSCPKTLGTPR
jgi:hypothetical protein